MARAVVAGRLMPPARVPTLGARFEAIILDWDGTAVPDRRADATAVRERFAALMRAGVDIVVITGTHVGNVDGQLQMRIEAPGALFICVNRGSEVFRCDAEGPRQIWRRDATDEENAALDRAAERTVAALARRGLPARIVSERLNRRKIDIIDEPEWQDPPKARIDELLDAVNRRLAGTKVPSLEQVVALALRTAKRAGLADPRVTSDVKHVEIGLTDKSDAARWAFERLAAHGVGPSQVLVAGDEFGPLGGVQGSDSLLLVPTASRSTAVSVGVEPDGVPSGVRHIGGGPDAFIALLDEQVARRADVPRADEDPRWSVTFVDGPPELQRVRETLLTVGDGTVGTRGALDEDGSGTTPLVVVAGAYEGEGPATRYLHAPHWEQLDLDPIEPGRRTLDMRTGVLHRISDGLRTVRFAAVHNPGVVVLRAQGDPHDMAPGAPLVAPDDTATEGSLGDVHWMRVRSASSSVTAAAAQQDSIEQGVRTVERIAVFDASEDLDPPHAPLVGRLAAARAAGFNVLLRKQREAWADRWAYADVAIEGDPALERALRFGMFHLMSSAGERGETGIGARGLSGPAYSGHVFWDSDIFVLPFLAATRPRAARAMLSYRFARLPAARRIAAARGYQGARFPWESAGEGSDVTPRSALDATGNLVAIRTGDLEEHITADVAWAAQHYADWTGDAAWESGAGRALIVETARYWATRVRRENNGSRRAHIYGVIGPDEYHESVDDNAFTNVMARWNLRRGADLLDGIDGEEAALFREIAGELCDGFDPQTLIYEQFAGYYGLEPLTIASFAEVPVAADVLLGRERTAGSQIIKQADVLMLHHLVPDEVAPGSLGPNLAFYGPRTAHGSSLSPGIQASLAARNGDLQEALRHFRIAAMIDLEDLTQTTAGGLHMATMGGTWQAFVFGFLGVRVRAGTLSVDPNVPATWGTTAATVRVGGTRVRIEVRGDLLDIGCDGPLRIQLTDGVHDVDAPGIQAMRNSGGWGRR